MTANSLQASLTEDGRYRLLIESVRDYAIYMLDLEGRVTSWNAGAQRLKGYEPAEIIGRHFSTFYTPEDRAAGRPEVTLAVAKREGKFEAEGWRVRKDGSLFWAHVMVDVIHTPDGALLGFAKITRDLTAQKAAQDALRRSEEQFRRLVLGVTDYAIYMLDPQGLIVSWNAGAERIKGYKQDEIIGQHFSRFYSQDDRTRGEPERGLERARSEGRFEKTGWRYRKDGSHFWAHVVIDAIHDDDGNLLGFAKITRDITEQREAQRALEKTREALMQSQKMEAMGQLTGGIAHDFNNLLMAVIGSLELAKKRMTGEDPRVRSLVDNAVQAAQRGASLIQRMLSFARRQDLKPKPLDLRALVAGMSDLLQQSLGPSLHVETHFPLVLGPVLADANQLELALLNLAVNARDAMQQDGAQPEKLGRLIIAAREETISENDTNAKLPAGRYICLSVTDNGEGMDEHTLARAAEPFFTTKGIGKGTGLGLSMVHGMMEQSGGRLVIKSRKGEGTTAELWLPMAEQNAEETPRLPPAPTLSDKPAPRVVLAVDDDALVLMNTTAMLEDLGHTVFEAMSGAEALEILKREPQIDLLITDQVMPRMSGSQLAQAVRALRPEIPIILATGYAELPPEADGRLPKLSKPFREQELARIIADTVRPPSEVIPLRRVQKNHS